MVTVGVISKKQDGNTEKLIKAILRADGKKAVCAENVRLEIEERESLEDAGVEFLILTLNKNRIRPIYLDILLLESCDDITSELVKCVAPDTRLVYIVRDETLPVFVHPNAVSCGMAYRAEATASSIDYKCDGVSFVYCLQRRIESIYGEAIEAGEKKIYIPEIKTDIATVIAAVTCTLICGAKNCDRVRVMS